LLDVLIGSEWRTLIAGEAASVLPGTVHTYIKRLCSAASKGNLGDLSGIRALLYIAGLVRENPLHSRAPGRVPSAAVPALAAWGASSGSGESSRLDLRSCSSSQAGAKSMPAGTFASTSMRA
jgi:hypothetical protein